MIQDQVLLQWQEKAILCNTTSGAFTATLPASPSLGDECYIGIDYAGTFDTNNLTVAPEEIQNQFKDTAADLTVAIERAAFTLVYVLMEHKVGY